MKRHALWMPALCCGLWAAPLAAVTDPEPEGVKEPDHVHGPNHVHHEIEEVVVQATPLARNLVELSQSATVLNGAELQRELANNLGETMTRLPGLSNASFGQNVGRPVIRGLQGQRVGVLANNMSSGDVSAVSQDHAVSVEPFLADQIEVLRGPSTLLYGSGAIGGIVNVVTHTIPQEQPERPISGRAIAQLDSVSDQRMAAARLDGGHGQLAFHVNAFARRSDDYEIPVAAEVGDHDEHEDHAHEDDVHGGVLENSFLDNEGGSLGAAWIGDRWRAGAAWTSYDSDYGIPGGHAHEGEEDEHDDGADHGDSHDEEEGVSIGLESERWEAELIGDNLFAGLERLKFRLAEVEYTHTEFEGDEVGTVFDSEALDTRLELRHEPWGPMRGALGVQYLEVDFMATGEEAFVPDTETRTLALFWLESFEFEHWQADLGLRYEDTEIDVTELDAAGHSSALAGRDRFAFDPLSVSLGAVWHLNEDHHLSFSLAHAERAPTAQELLAFGPHVANQTFEIGNPDLVTERNLHGEIAYRVHGGALTGSVVLYTDRFDDYIYQENTGEEADGFPVRQWSQQDADFTGGEIELRYDLGRHDSGHWQFFGFYDRVRAELKDGQNVPLMPPQRIGVGIDWHREAWALTATWIHAGAHDRVAEFETRTPGYDLLNAELSWAVPAAEMSDWEVFLKGQNLLDEEIRNSTSQLKDRAPQAGRNFVLGLRGRF